MLEKNIEARLKAELVALVRYMERVKYEIATVYRPSDSEFGFEKMGDQMDAIVESTEQAAHSIMGTVEDNEALLDQLRERLKDDGDLALLKKISFNNSLLFETCSFQDITGQRVTKIAKSLTYVEDRVTSLVNSWGREELEEVVIEVDAHKTDDEKLIKGPSSEGEGFSQMDIDALFD